MSGSATFFEAIKGCCTIYALSESMIPDKKIQKIISEVIKHAPSSFNSQSSHAMLLLRDEHKKLLFSVTEGYIKGLAAGHSTILFFEDENVIKDLQTKFALYADHFSQKFQDASSILQYITWTVLKMEGLSILLQHYNPLITAHVWTQMLLLVVSKTSLIYTFTTAKLQYLMPTN